jgi:L-ascorbate metabolism protein UlaG (beta-lactamase superfamily)
VFESLPHEEIELLFLPINGEGNNMNFDDGKKFAERVKAKKVVPIHLGLLDDKNAESWAVENKILPNIYQEIAY